MFEICEQANLDVDETVKNLRESEGVKEFCILHYVKRNPMV